MNATALPDLALMHEHHGTGRTAVGDPRGIVEEPCPAKSDNGVKIQARAGFDNLRKRRQILRP